MHSDQTRKDGSSESMIQALYYDFVANYVKTRMYSTRYVQCNSGGQSSADRGATESSTMSCTNSAVQCHVILRSKFFLYLYIYRRRAPVVRQLSTCILHCHAKLLLPSSYNTSYILYIQSSYSSLFSQKLPLT